MTHFGLFLAGTAMFAPAAAWAQSADKPVAEQAAATDATNVDIVVTAQRRAERLQDVPISLTVVSAPALAAAGITNTQSLERVTPGLTMQQQNGYINPSLRGISTTVVTAGAENPVAMYIDGVYNGNMGAGAFSLADVDHIEVLKGPQGTLFGRNATGGAIQIFTKAPSMTPTGDVSVSAGMFTGAGTSRTAYDLNIKGYVSGPLIADMVAASVSFSATRSNGYGTNDVYGRVSPAADRALGNDRFGKHNDYSVRAKLLFRPSETFEAVLTGYYTHTDTERGQGGFIPYNGTLLTETELSFPGRITSTEPWHYAFDALRPAIERRSRGTSLKADLETGIGTLTSTTAYSYSFYAEDNDSDNSYIPGCLAVFACTAPYDDMIEKAFQQELLFTSKTMGRLNFVAGANYYRANSRVDVEVNDFEFGSQPLGGATNVALFYYHQKVRTRALGVFAQGDFAVTDQLTLTAGLRYSDEKKSGTLIDLGSLGTNFVSNLALARPHSKKWTPRVSLRYELAPNTSVYASFSQGFKSSVIPGGAPGAPEVKPEKITAYEVGFKTAQPTYTFNIAAFYYNYSDLQVQTNGGAGGVVNIVDNAAKARIYGLDVDGTLKITPQLSIRGGVSWLPYAKYLDYVGAPINLPRVIDPNNPLVTGLTCQPGFFCPNTNVDLSGTRMFKTPKVTLTASATYRTDIGAGDLSFTPNIYYASILYTEPTHISATSTDNFKLGAEIAYQPHDSGWRVSLWGRNLTNNSAFMSLSNNGSGMIQLPPDPQEIGLTFGLAF